MAEILIRAEIFWYHEAPDGSVCMGCKELVCSEVYKPMLQIGRADDLNFIELDIKVCKSCYDQINKQCH